MANSKIIIYDLQAPGKDYKSLIDRLKQYPKACRVCESSWIVETSWSTTQIREDLTGYMDSNDRIFVGSLTGEASWRNPLCSHDSIKEAL